MTTRDAGSRRSSPALAPRWRARSGNLLASLALAVASLLLLLGLLELGVRVLVPDTRWLVNGGVQGYWTDQALLLMQRWVPAYIW